MYLIRKCFATQRTCRKIEKNVAVDDRDTTDAVGPILCKIEDHFFGKG